MLEQKSTNYKPTTTLTTTPASETTTTVTSGPQTETQPRLNQLSTTVRPKHWTRVKNLDLETSGNKIDLLAANTKTRKRMSRLKNHRRRTSLSTFLSDQTSAGKWLTPRLNPRPHQRQRLQNQLSQILDQQREQHFLVRGLQSTVHHSGQSLGLHRSQKICKSGSRSLV